jgi:hypothetical protein
LARWAFSLQDYDFDIINKVRRVNQDVNGLSWNPNFNKEDTIGLWWHGDVDLERVLRWHVYTYMCTMLGCFREVLQVIMNNMDSQEGETKLKNNGIQYMHDD